MNWVLVGLEILDIVLYSFIGILLLGLGIVIVRLIIPLNLKREIEDEQNISLAILFGLIIVALSIIIGSVLFSPSLRGYMKTVSTDKPPAEDTISPGKKAVK